MRKQRQGKIAKRSADSNKKNLSLKEEPNADSSSSEKQRSGRGRVEKAEIARSPNLCPTPQNSHSPKYAVLPHLPHVQVEPCGGQNNWQYVIITIAIIINHHQEHHQKYKDMK